MRRKSSSGKRKASNGRRKRKYPKVQHWHRSRKSRTVKKASRQKGTPKSVARDRLYRALTPGKRISKSGKVYYEYRANRSDVNPRRGL